MTKRDQLLKALDSANDKALSHSAARKAIGATMRGYQTIRRSLMDQRLIAWTNDAGGVQITFGGIQRVKGSS